MKLPIIFIVLYTVSSSIFAAEINGKEVRRAPIQSEFDIDCFHALQKIEKESSFKKNKQGFVSCMIEENESKIKITLKPGMFWTGGIEYILDRESLDVIKINQFR